jgi:hypothetical protein
VRADRALARRPDRARRLGAPSRRRASLCDSLNRVLDTGAVVMGELVISVAGVDLLYLNLNVLLSSVETLLDAMEVPGKHTAKEGETTCATQT